MKHYKAYHAPFFNFSRFFEDLFSKENQEWNFGSWCNFGIYIPAANIRETASAFILEMTAPGREKADFSIHFQDNNLTISVPKKELEGLKEEEQYTRKEFAYPAFNRRFHFPKQLVDEAKISAKYTNGILRVILPKVDVVQTGKDTRIEVD